MALQGTRLQITFRDSLGNWLEEMKVPEIQENQIDT